MNYGDYNGGGTWLCPIEIKHRSVGVISPHTTTTKDRVNKPNIILYAEWKEIPSSYVSFFQTLSDPDPAVSVPIGSHCPPSPPS